jgi:F-type H+-transporting ATPase subunit delta
MDLLPFIRDEFDALLRDAEATLEVGVTSAQALDEAAQARLNEALARRYGRRIQLNLHQDPALVAGIVLEVEGEVIDGSMRGRLQRLAGALAHGN